MRKAVTIVNEGTSPIVRSQEIANKWKYNNYNVPVGFSSFGSVAKLVTTKKVSQNPDETPNFSVYYDQKTFSSGNPESSIQMFLDWARGQKG